MSNDNTYKSPEDFLKQMDPVTFEGDPRSEIPKFQASDSAFGPYRILCQLTLPIGRPSEIRSTMRCPLRSLRRGPLASASRSVGSFGRPMSIL